MRVLGTAIGVVSPLASSAEGTLQALVEGRRAQRQVTLFDVADLRARLAAEVPDLRVADVAPRGEADAMIAGAACIVDPLLDRLFGPACHGGDTWAGVPALEVAPRAGEHEALGGVALAAGAAAIAAGQADEVLVAERTAGRWFAARLVRPIPS